MTETNIERSFCGQIRDFYEILCVVWGFKSHD